MSHQTVSPPPFYTPMMLREGEQEIFNPIWVKWLSDLSAKISVGHDATITTAPLTGGGTSGSMTFVSGVLVDQTQAT